MSIFDITPASAYVNAIQVAIEKGRLEAARLQGIPSAAPAPQERVPLRSFYYQRAANHFYGFARLISEFVTSRGTLTSAVATIVLPVLFWWIVSK